MVARRSVQEHSGRTPRQAGTGSYHASRGMRTLRTPGQPSGFGASRTIRWTARPSKVTQPHPRPGVSPVAARRRRAHQLLL